MIIRGWTENMTARRTYAAYAEAVKHLTHDGQPMPAWEDLATETQEGWRMAAIEGFRAHNEELASKTLPKVYREPTRWKPLTVPAQGNDEPPLPPLSPLSDEAHDVASTPIEVVSDTDRG